MGYYFKMYKNDLNDFFLSTESKNGLIDVVIGITIKTFSCRLVEDYETTVTLEIEQNIDKKTGCRTLILIPRNYPLSDKIKVHLVDNIEGAYIGSDYNDYRKNEVKQTYYFTLTKDECDMFIYKNKNGDIQTIKTTIWNNDHTDFILGHVLIEPVITVSTSSDLLTFRILGFDNRNFTTSKDSYNAYKKPIYYENICNKIVEFFTDLDDCIRFTKTKKEEPRITNKLEEQCSWDCKPLNMSKKETKMTIKDIKLNGPATILFTTDNKKVVVKCRLGDNYDPEKGILMVLCKYIMKEVLRCQNWTEVFNIPYSDEIDVEKVIALSMVKGYFYKKDKDWHYNYILKYIYNANDYSVEDRVKALKALNYSVERIARCLGITKGEAKDILESKEKTILDKAKESLLSYLNELKKVSSNKSKITVTGTKDPYIENLLKEKPELKNNTNPYEVPDHKPCNMEELPKKQKDVISDQDIIDLFNKGYSISKISKELGLTEYFVKKYLDAYTNPKTEKKAARILKKATKEKIVHKKHVRRTQIDYPNYLDKETCDKVLERTKEKYKDHDKIQCLSELQRYFIMECKREYIITHYGNGYDMYAIAKVIGTNAASVQRIWNAYKSGKEK